MRSPAMSESDANKISHSKSASSLPRLDSREDGAGAVPLEDGGCQGAAGGLDNPARSTSSLDSETPGPIPAQSSEQALRFEWFHECAGKNCTKRINTRFRFCRPCSGQKAWVEPEEQRWRLLADDQESKPYGDEKWPRDRSVACGCTLRRIPVPKGGARDRYPPDPTCAA